MQALIKVAIPLVIIVALLYFLFGRAPKIAEPVVPEPTPVVDTSLEVAEPTPLPTSDEMTTEPTATPVATPTATATPVASESIDGLSKSEQEQITREVQVKFEDLIYYDDLPSSQEERYKYLMDGFSTSLFYLNEVAAKNIETTPENLAKAMKFLALYATQGNASEIDDSIRIIAKENPARYQEALMDLSESESMVIKEVIDNLESELNHAPMEQ